MSTPSTFADLARALHHRRHREALALIDALLAQMPDSNSLQRQRAMCAEAMAEEEAAAVQPPELMRVDATLFSFDQQRDCNAPAPDLRVLGFTPLLDAASPAFPGHGMAPTLIRFFGDEGGDSVVVRVATILRHRPLQLLACATAYSDGRVLLTQRDGEWPLKSHPFLVVHRLPPHASLTELVTRHAGRCAIALRNDPALARRPVLALGDCDLVWRAIVAEWAPPAQKKRPPV